MKKKYLTWMSLTLVGVLWLAGFWGRQSAEAARQLAVTASLTPSPTMIPVAVFSPQSGQAVQGVVPVMVNTVVEGFLSSELYFGYSADPTTTWFLIAQQELAISGAAFATWDTTTISDGDYTLRLVVTVRDQEPILYLVEGLRVRNYSPVETDTPTPSPTLQPGDLPTQTPTLVPTFTPIPPTPTLLPTNPAILSIRQLGKSAGLGGLAAWAAISLVGVYVTARQRRRRR